MGKGQISYCLLGIGVVALAISYRVGSSLSGAGDNVKVSHSVPLSTHVQKKSLAELNAKTVSGLLAKAKSARDVKLALGNLGPGQLYTLGDGNAFSAAVDTWYEQGPEFALNLISSLPREYRKTAFQWGQEFYLQNPLLFIASANASLSPSEASSIALKIFVKLGEHDPKRAIELIEKQGQGDAKTVNIGGAYAAWSSKDIKAALLSVKSLSFPEDKDAAYGAIIENVKNQGVEFIDFIDKVAIPEGVRSQIAQAILTQVALQEGPEQLGERYRKNPSLIAYGNSVIKELGDRDWLSFSKNLSRYLENGIVIWDRDAETIGQGIAGKSPEAAMDFLNTLPAKNRPAAAAGIARTLADKTGHRQMLMNMIRTLPAGPDRAAAALPLIQALQGERKSREIEELESFLSN